MQSFKLSRGFFYIHQVGISSSGKRMGKHVLRSTPVIGMVERQFQTSSLMQSLVEREGFIVVRQTQKSFPLDEKFIESVLRQLLVLTSCAHMDVGVWLTSDAKVREMNTNYRGLRKSTDILSFPFHENLCAVNGDALPDRMASIVRNVSDSMDTTGTSSFQQSLHETDESLIFIDQDIAPKSVPAIEFTEDDMNLGDMVVSVPYVVRAIRRDAKAMAKAGVQAWAAEAGATPGVSGEMMRFTTAPTTTFMSTADCAAIYADNVNGEDEEQLRKCLEARVALLLVHGVCHLLGHDHESDRQHTLMAEEEERLVRGLFLNGLLPNPLL